jgi:hypothetical protein
MIILLLVFSSLLCTVAAVPPTPPPGKPFYGDPKQGCNREWAVGCASTIISRLWPVDRLDDILVCTCA